jgi:hypothetical protein
MGSFHKTMSPALVIFLLGNGAFVLFVIICLIGQLMIWYERIFKNEKEK